MDTNVRDITAKHAIARGIKEAASLVGVSASFVRKEISLGHLKETRLGRRVLIKDSDLVAWLNRNDNPKQEAA
jgi:excisionase family DNA binding protein